MTGPVVVGIDDFEHSDQLVAVAAREARLRYTALWLTHVHHGAAAPAAPGVPVGFSPEQALREAVEARLAEFATAIQAEYPDLRVQTAAVTGPTAHALAEAADVASLLVVGGRGRGGFTGQLLGSVSLRVLSLAHCPVLVVRGETDPDTQRVMIGIDVDDPAAGSAVLDFAFDEAARRHADVYAFHAWEDPSFLYASGGQVFMHQQRAASLKRTTEALTAALDPWQDKYPDLVVTGQVLAGPPAKLLVESTRLVDLLVIGGKPRRDGHDGMRVGSLAHTVLHHAHCPVVIVPES